VRDAVVAVDRDRFGRRSGKDSRFERVAAGKLKPVHDDFGVTPDRSSLVGEAKAARRPPKQLRERSVVATRAPKLDPEPQLEPRRASKQRARTGGAVEAGAPDGGPPPRLVKPSREAKHERMLASPPFGKKGESRSTPPPAPRYQKPAERTQAPASAQRHERAARPQRALPLKPERVELPKAERVELPKRERVEVPKPERVELGRPERSERAKPGRSEPARPALPGEPANRVYRSERYERPSSMPREHSSEAREPRLERGGEQRDGIGKGRASGGFGDVGRGHGR